MATITSTTSWDYSVWGTWVWWIAPVLGDKVVIASWHTVTLDWAIQAWDDTSTAFTVNSWGKLKASRTMTSGITFRWQFVLNWALDFWTRADPIPSTYRATFTLNDSASMANGKYGITIGASCTQLAFWWADKTPYTTITSTIDSSNFIVADITWWEVGDYLFLWSTAHTGATTEAREISAITPWTGTTGTITLTAALTNANFVWRAVGNVTRNVKATIKTPETYSCAIQFILWSTVAANTLELWCTEFVWRWHTSGLAAEVFITASSTQLVECYRISAHDVVSISGSTVTSTVNTPGATTSFCISVNIRLPGYAVEPLACTLNNSNGIGWGNWSNCNLQNPYILWTRWAIWNLTNSGNSAKLNITNPTITGCTSIIAPGASAGPYTITGWAIDWYSNITQVFTASSVVFSWVDMEGLVGVWSPTALVSTNTAAWITLENCDIPSTTTLTRASASWNVTTSLFFLYFKNKDNVSTVQEYTDATGLNYSDYSTIYRGLSSMRLDPWYAWSQKSYTVSIPVVANQAITVIWATRWNSTYTSTYPPSVTMEWNGITPVVVTNSSAVDTWEPYTISVTNPNNYPGVFTLTYKAKTTANSASASAWFDGVINTPWVNMSRHYGYEFGIDPYLTVNQFITETTEATVWAYTGIAIDHWTQTLTISSSHSIEEIYDYVYYDLCQTANLWYAEWFTTTNGTDFSCTYDIVNDDAITGTGTITTTGTYTWSGDYDLTITDSTWVFNHISITGLVANSRVRINNETDNIELYNGVVAWTSLSIASFWSTNKTLDVRVTNVIGTTAYLPFQVWTTLTSTWASILAAQELDTVYNTNAIDGSTITEFSADYPNVQVDIDDGDGSTSVQRLYAWFEYAMHSSQGIITYFNGISAQDTLNYQVNTNVVDLEFDNVSASSLPIKITGAYIYRDDGTTVIYANSKSIQMDPARAYQVWVSGLTTAQNDQLFAIWRSMWGGSGFSEIFKSNLASTRNEIIRKIEDSTTEIESKIDENESHHKVANDKIITTIEDIEKGINTEIKSVNKGLSTDNVATRQLIRQKAKKQEEFIQKQLDSEAKTQKMIDDEADSIEEALWIVDDENITKALEQADSEHEQNIIEALNSL